MARSVSFNGIVRFKPGGITKVNASALNQILLSANSVVGLVGEAEGGAPGSEGLVALADPSQAVNEFRSGPLVDAIRQAFQSSNDPDVPGGASQVVVYKTNSSTQSTVSLPNEEADELVDSTSTGGSSTTVEDTSLGSTFPDDEFNNKYLVLDPFTANAEVRTITDYDSSTQTFTVDTAFAATPVTTPYKVFDEDVEVIDSIDTGSSTNTLIAFNDIDISEDQHNGRWLYIQDTATTSYLRKISDTDGTAETVTLANPLPAVPTSGAFAMVLSNVVDVTSEDWGSHTTGIKIDVDDGSTSGTKVLTVSFEGEEEVSPDLGGSVYLKVLYKGGAVSTTDTVDTDSTASVINLVTGGLTIGAEVGKQVLIDGEYSEITSNTATSITLTPALSSAPSSGTTVNFMTVTGGTMTVSGSAGSATSLSTDITGVSGDDLSITFSNIGTTLRDLANRINQEANYEALIPSGINADTTLLADLDFGPDTEATILASTNIATEGLKRDTMAVVDYINDFSELVTASRSSDTGSSYAGCCPPKSTDESLSLTGGSRGTSTNTSFQNALDELLKVRVNSVVPLIDQDLTNEGFGSTATVASVAAQLVDHVTQARGAAQMIAGERGGFVGFRGTKSEIIAQANALNDMDVHLVPQNPTTLSASGTLKEFGPRMAAVMAASMRAGVTEVATPLTHKLVRTAGVTQDSSWDPNDLTDANDFIKNGILFMETVDGVGTRWVRDLTTWVANDNLAFSEGSVRDAVRFVAFELRSTLVSRFTGKKSSPATIANVKDAAATVLELMRQDNIIVDSTDPATGAFLRAWHNLKVTSSGDIVRINVGLFPVPGINFQLTELFLQLPTQSA